MGLCLSSHAESAQAAVHKEIELGIAQEKRKHVLKLLLLGTGESGKSTILKQMKILHRGGIEQHDMHYHASMIYTNIVEGMNKVLDVMLGAHFVYDDGEIEDHSKALSSVRDSAGGKMITEPFGDALCAALRTLWAKPELRGFYKANKHRLHIPDSLQYFMDELDRICLPGYEPSNQDLLYIRVPTVGVTECVFPVKNTQIRVIDVGGQRSQRRKWIHCFDDVDSLVFVASLSDYNQTLPEDEGQNRMAESLRVFAATVNSEWFARKSVILFLNKKDLLAEQLALCPITAVFPDYTGPSEYAPALEHIKYKFERLVERRAAERHVYTFVTCATDTDQVHMIIDSVIDMTIQAALNVVEIR